MKISNFKFTAGMPVAFASTELPFAAALFIFVFLGSIFPITDNDVWWHLATGKYIFLNHLIPSTDIFSFTIKGKPWVTFEWLSQLVFYAVYSVSGLFGLTAFKALACVLIFYLMSKRFKTGITLVSAAVFCLAFIAARDGLKERPQLFTYLFTALYMYLLETKHERRMFIIPIVQVLWANMHGASAFIGIGIFSIYTLFDDSVPAGKKAFFIFLVSACTLANPHTYSVFTYLFVFFKEGFNTLIQEYQRTPVKLNYLPYFLLVFLGFVSFLADDVPDIKSILIFIIAVAASLLAIRNIPLFVVIAAPVTASQLSKMTASLTYGKVKHALLVNTLAAVCLFLGSWSFASMMDLTGSCAAGFGDKHRSRGAAAFIKSTGARGCLFNDYDLGGYLIWKLYPQCPVFVDGRLVEYGKDFVEKSFYYWKPEVWAGLDSRYNFTLAVIPNDIYYFASNFDNLDNWVLVFWDKGALVYAKRVPENIELIKKFGYRYLRPNSPDQSYLAKIPKEEIDREIKRSLYYAPSLKD